MALKNCEKCRKTFWTDLESRLCPICTVIEKGKQLVEQQRAVARTAVLSVPKTVAR
jgi:hypothetical protein